MQIECASPAGLCVARRFKRYEVLPVGQDTTMIALDSNAMTYWIDAMSSVGGPPDDPCEAEKIALARIFFWMPDQSAFHLTPTVENEYQAIRDRAKLDDHISWALVHLCSVRPLPDPIAVDARTTELTEFHNGPYDCRIVAECELTEVLTLLTCDPRMLRNLRDKTKGVQIRRPTECWTRMAVRKGERPSRVPHQTNPLSRCNWWRW